jgi:hypothetical protein
MSQFKFRAYPFLIAAVTMFASIDAAFRTT